IDQHAAVQRQFADRGGLDDFAYAGVCGAQDFVACGDSDSFTKRAYLQRNIERGSLADLQAKALAVDGETRGFDLQLIFVGQESGGFKKALLIGDRAANGSGACCGQFHRGAGDGKLLRVGDRSGQGGVVALPCAGRTSRKSMTSTQYRLVIGESPKKRGSAKRQERPIQ